MERLFEVAKKERIQIIERTPLPESYLGLYYQSHDYKPAAFLSDSIYGISKLENVILAEEIGHYFTVTEHNIPKFFRNHEHKLLYTRQEYRASRKGSQLLIYPDEILDAISSGIEEIWDLADHFQVTEDFMAFRLEVWKISGK